MKIEELIKQLKLNTEHNLHTENYILLANHFGLKNTAKIFESILAIQNIEGYLPEKLSDYRNEKYKNLMFLVQGIVDNDEIYKQIYNSL